MATTCSDPEVFFFPNVPAGTQLTWSVTGPVGQFSVTVTHKIDQQPSTSQPDAGTITLTPGAHTLGFVIFFVTACQVTVRASCGPHKYCRQIAGAAATFARVDLSVVAV